MRDDLGTGTTASTPPESLASHHIHWPSPHPLTLPLPAECLGRGTQEGRFCLHELLEAAVADTPAAPGLGCLPAIPSLFTPLHSSPCGPSPHPRGSSPLLSSSHSPLPAALTLLPPLTKPFACQTQGTAPIFILMMSRGTRYGAIENPLLPVQLSSWHPLFTSRYDPPLAHADALSAAALRQPVLPLSIPSVLS